MLLHAYEHFEVHLADRGGDTLLVTFNEMGLTADGQRFWADSLAEKLGLSAAGFITRAPNWFPAHHTRPAIARLMEVLRGRFPRRICYGMSQGAYAALRYQADLGADLALAFSPQASIDPAVIEDPRFNGYFRAELHADMVPESSDAPLTRVVFFDPKDLADQRHVVLLRQRFAMIEFPLPYIGHSSAVPFAQSETMRQVLDLGAARDWPGLREICLAARRRSPSRPYAICHATGERWPRLTLRIFEKYRARYPDNDWWWIGRLLALRGLGGAVLEEMLRQAEAHAGDAGALACAAAVAVELGHKRLAQSFVARALALDPGNPHWVWLRERAEMVSEDAV